MLKKHKKSIIGILTLATLIISTVTYYKTTPTNEKSNLLKTDLVSQNLIYPRITSCSPNKTSIKTGESVTFTINYTNPNQNQFTDNYTTEINLDYNDGTLGNDQIFNTNKFSGNSLSYTHTYNSAGQFQATYGDQTLSNSNNSSDNTPFFYSVECGSPIIVSGDSSEKDDPSITSCTSNKTDINVGDAVTFTLQYSNTDNKVFPSNYLSEINLYYNEGNSKDTTTLGPNELNRRTITFIHTYNSAGTYQPYYSISTDPIANSQGSNDNVHFIPFFNCSNSITVRQNAIKTNNSNVSLQTPTLLYPHNNSVFGIKNISLNWSLTNNDANYEVEIVDLNHNSSNTFTTKNTYIDTNSDGDMAFKWRVRTIYGSQKSAWSDYNYFSIQLPTPQSTTSPITTDTNNSQNQLHNSASETKNTIPQGFNDTSSSKYAFAIGYLKKLGIINGYEDGSFKPYSPINRAELLKIAIGSGIKDNVWKDSNLDNYKQESCFSDVAPNQWYTPYICWAKANKIISGYKDGSFKPYQSVTVSEGLKIAMTIYNNTYKESTPWYRDLVVRANKLQLYPFPDSDENALINYATTEMTRQDMAELITRVRIYNQGGIETYFANPNHFLENNN